MAAALTEAEFTKHVHTKFETHTDDDAKVELELDQVKSYSNKPEAEGMERFSLFFRGPEKPFLPQLIYTLRHDQMGEFDLFLVPIARRDDGFRYEAVFNYYKDGVKAD